jgi:ribosomal protein S27AE
MAEWHWYCDTHGWLDRNVQVCRRRGTTVGRCPRCGAEAVWAEQSTVPTTAPYQQLALFGDRS